MLELYDNLPKLKRCAHCGSNNVSIEECRDSINCCFAYIICNECGIRTPKFEIWSPISSPNDIGMESRAINALVSTWNKRANDIVPPPTNE